MLGLFSLKTIRIKSDSITRVNEHRPPIITHYELIVAPVSKMFRVETESSNLGWEITTLCLNNAVLRIVTAEPLVVVDSPCHAATLQSGSLGILWDASISLLCGFEVAKEFCEFDFESIVIFPV